MNIETRQIKVWEEGYTIDVAPRRLLNELSYDGGVSFKNSECEYVDETIGYYVTDKQFDTLTDAELEELVNREGYDWEGEPPTKS